MSTKTVLVILVAIGTATGGVVIVDQSGMLIQDEPEPPMGIDEPVSEPSPDPILPVEVERIEPIRDIGSTVLQATIVPAADSGRPGCEETATGCYLPNTVTVRMGGVVTFENTDVLVHTFTAGSQSSGPTGEFDSSLLMSGNTFEFRPNEPGEIPYFCIVHPWMQGTIVVVN